MFSRQRRSSLGLITSTGCSCDHGCRGSRDALTAVVRSRGSSVLRGRRFKRRLGMFVIEGTSVRILLVPESAFSPRFSSNARPFNFADRDPGETKLPGFHRFRKRSFDSCDDFEAISYNLRYACEPATRTV